LHPVQLDSNATPIRIELPFRPDSVNVYLFRQPEPVLIDAGYNSTACWDALVAGLAEQHLTPADLKHVVITHPHIDHYGLAARIARESDAKVWIAHGAMHVMRLTNPQWGHRLAYYHDVLLPGMGLPDDMIERFAANVNRTALHSEPVADECLFGFGEGDVFHWGGVTWQTLHTPGHDSQQMCFYQPETRQLISGDMLLAKAPTPVVDAPNAGEPRKPSLPAFMQSLDRLEAMDIDVVYPGHGELFWQHRQVIQAQRERILNRKEECYQHVKNGINTVAGLLKVMYAYLPLEHGMVGLWMLLGYLDLLRAEERVCETIVERAGGIGAVWHYTVC